MTTNRLIDDAELRRGRTAIIAGGGRLPVDLANGLKARGVEPLIVGLEGEVTDPAAFADLPGFTLTLEETPGILALLKREGVTRVVFGGTVSRRPKVTQMRPLSALAPIVVRVARALVRGDDNLLRAIVTLFEERGIEVVGAHQLMPELVISEGVHTKYKPSKADRANVAVGFEAAKAIGHLDIGQAAVAIGGRVIALEGIEGTDGLLERVAGMRGHGRLAGKKGGALVKTAKPNQEMRTDLPSIGVQTVIAAHAAGLNGIAVEADSSLALGFGEMIEKADELGLFIAGVHAGKVGST